MLYEDANKRFNLLLESLIDSDNVISILGSLQYQPVTKKKIVYSPVDISDTKTQQAVESKMLKLTYAKSPVKMKIVTTTTDGKETENTAEVGDIIMSGPSKEKYVIKPEKFEKLYDKLGVTGNVVPNQSKRYVARYEGNKDFKFKASWGEDMIVKSGDYIVKDGEDSFYRIAKKEYEATYNPIK